MLFMGIFHQRDENLLHLLIARVLFSRLFLSKVQGILGLFFVAYQQEKIAKYGAKHTQGCWNRILLPSMCEMPSCKQIQRNKF